MRSFNLLRVDTQLQTIVFYGKFWLMQAIGFRSSFVTVSFYWGEGHGGRICHAVHALLSRRQLPIRMQAC